MSTIEKPRLKVLFFTNLFPTPTDATRGIFHLQLVRELAKICDVTVVCPLPWFPRWSFLKRFARWYAFAEIPSQYEIRGIQVYSPKYAMLPKVSGALQGLLVYLGSFGLIRKLHHRSKFDLINALWLYPDAVAAARMAKRLGIPMVPAALGCDVNRMFHEADKRDRILDMLNHAPRVISVSDGLRESMAAAGIPKARISTIANGVNSDLFFNRDKQEERARLGLPADRKIIVYVGRLSEEKGLTTLVSAAAQLHDRGIDFFLCIVGDGPQMAELRENAATLGVASNIRFVGHQDHDAIAGWLGACDVFCLPSLREGCPNVVIEALASGRPVVASRVGGIPDMVVDSTGILIPPQEPAALATALESALQRDWNERAIAESVSGNTWRAAAETYAGIYRDAVESRTVTTPGAV
ncbi:MAG: glycosyltransferase family 4 protein [Betaproteobacteria bacterium]|nr:glycosyltransferase family 4 protein [Betaproteobacteria bacterium]